MSRTGRLPRLLMGVALVGSGCTGTIGAGRTTGPDGTPVDDPGNGGGPVNTGPKPEPPKPGETPNLAGPMPLRRLTIFELNNTIRDLLGDASNPGSTLAVDLPSAVGYGAGAKIVTSVDARAFLDLSTKLTDTLAAKVASLLPQGCSAPAASAEDGCAKTFIKQFGLRAYRRPLQSDEEADLYALYTKQRSAEIGANFLDSIRVLVTGMLQSPYFLYRWELGGAPQKDGVLVKLNSYEIASRLSYYLWASMPDTALFDAAGRNELQTPEQISAQARRLMTDAKFKDGLSDFSQQWLGVVGLPTLEKDESFTAYTAEVGQSMLDETANFFASLMFGPQANGKLNDLYASNKTVVDDKLAKFYGVTAGSDGKATFKDTERAGILTQAAFIAAHSDGDYPHPVKQGVHVLRNVFCQDIPGPPDGLVIPPLAERKMGDTTRARFEAAVAGKDICLSCHSLINPTGFAFEIYDAVGQYRTNEDGQKIDASGSVKLPSGTLTFNDGIELSKQIAQTAEARDCMSRQWLRYVLRRMETPDEAGSFKLALADFEKAGYDLRELMVSTTKTRAFTHRQPQEGEGSK
jgi:Protein of unknown function (DUF1592)/Protein of unknown function (DUF1588)/Protein of unknown function (DUF1595)/Protein of unknown function (DUF1585)